MEKVPHLEVLGVANILPLDHTYIVPRQGRISLASVVDQLRLAQPAAAENPTPGFTYSGYRRSGGGRIANVLAYLGTHRHSVAACGVVGADLSGDLVIDDLERHNIRTDHVKRLDGRFTRTVFIVTNGSSSHQIHVKRRPLARLSSINSVNLPNASVLLVGRFNKSVLDLCRRHRESHGAKIAVHIGSAPRWDSEVSTALPILGLADIAIFSGIAIRGTPRGVAEIPSRLTVVYEGINRAHARHSSGASFSVERGQYVAVSDPTGMLDCFHGALLSFLIRSGWRLDDEDVVKAALHFANEVSGFCGTGTGARHFPLSAQDDFVRTRHWDSIKRRNAVFVSHSSSDAVLISNLRKRLNDEPGTKVWVNDARPGDIVWDAVRAALEASNICLVVLTRAALGSTWVQKELAFACELRRLGKIRLIPIIVAINDEPARLWNDAANGLSLPSDLVYIDATNDVAHGRFPNDELLSRLSRAWSTESAI